MKKLLLIVIFLFVIIGSCSEEKKNTPNGKEKERKEEIIKDDKVNGKYWVNRPSGVIHNRTCRWYGNTKNGYYTNECKGRSCKICGGCN